MVSYYNTLSYSQKHSAANLAYSAGQPWQWPTNYHTPPNHQYLGEVDAPHATHHQMYYSPHAMFHSAAGAASEWHSPSSVESFAQNASTAAAHQMLQHHHLANGGGLIIGSGGGHGHGHHGGGGGSGSASSVGSGSSSASAGLAAGATQLNDTVSSLGDQQQQQQQQQHQQQQQQQPHPSHHIAEGLPSPPITVSGSEISSPGAPASSSSPHHLSHQLSTTATTTHNNNNNSPTSVNNNNNNSRASPVKAQYYEWMKKPSYPAQPTPGKTRTKDKYRVVYTDFQRLELEKEYCTSRYITIRRKTELAQTLALSERQVKIWFQNRRAKERKQNKKGADPGGGGGSMVGGVQHGDYVNLMDSKPKLEPGLHLQHPLHPMSSMSSMSSTMAAMSMNSMRLHPHLHGHHPLAAVSAAAAHSHQLHQSPHHAQMSVAAAAVAGVGVGVGVGSLPM